MIYIFDKKYLLVMKKKINIKFIINIKKSLYYIRFFYRLIVLIIKKHYIKIITQKIMK